MEKLFKKEAEVSIELVRKAVSATEKIRRNGILTVEKEDGTPLTQADVVAQAIILQGLKNAFPEDKILAEEDFQVAAANDLVRPACDALRALGLADCASSLEGWVNYRGNPDGRRIWMIDPIDGTKGYRLGLCYAVVMGLYYAGRPRFGCMAVPLFPGCSGQGHSVAVAYGGEGIGAYIMEGGKSRFARLRVSSLDRLSDFRMVGSRAHDRQGLSRRFMEKSGITQLMPMDGEGKYLMLASGRADLLLRSAETDHGIGFPWDHCAGQIILEEAGGAVSTAAGRPLNFEQAPGAPIRDLRGLVASNGRCHEEVLNLLQKVL